jgi:hypothetical protein
MHNANIVKQRKPFIWTFRLLGFALCMVLFAACFNTREPEPPSGPTNWTPPTDTRILLSNFAYACTAIDLVNYKRCFKEETYQFRADPTVSANNQGIFNNWNWDDEQQYLNNLNIRKSPSTNINALTFTNEQTNNFTVDSLEYTANYNYTIATTDTGLVATTFTGIVIFRMIRNRSNEWQIVHWSDNQRDNQPCWSDLKLYFFTR